MTESKIDATCTQNGETVYTCDDCEYSYKANIIEPKGHVFEKTVVNSTCTTDGYTEYRCACGYAYISDYISATGHEYVDTIVSPNCLTAGHTTHKCKNCEYSYISNQTDPVSHKYVESVVPPTCGDQGYTIFSCEKCDDEYISDYTAPLVHNITSALTAPTCTDTGYTTYSCSSCDYSYVSDYKAPTGHAMNKAVVSPTCISEGKTTYKCEVCSYSYSETVAPLGHSFSKIVTMPTLSDMGYTEYTCNRDECGYSYTGDLRFYNDILPNGAYANNSTVLAEGIDVSEYNYGNYDSIDFASLKDAGIDYVIIKAGSSYRDGFSKGGIDPKFEQSYDDAKAAGLDVGVYFYTYAKSVDEIVQDARLLLSILDGKQFEYPIYLDLEDDSLLDIDKVTITQMCVEFFTILQRAGYYTGLYVNNSWLYNQLQTEVALSKFEIWYARYSEASDQYIWHTDAYGENLGMWQYSDNGHFEAMEDIPFDLSFAYKNYPEIIKEGGFNGYNKEEIKFVDSDKVFVYVIANAINVRSSSDFDATDNLIGLAYKGDCLEVLEKQDEYLKIKFNGAYAYITANTSYISFEFPIQ